MTNPQDMERVAERVAKAIALADVAGCGNLAYFDKNDARALLSEREALKGEREEALRQRDIARNLRAAEIAIADAATERAEAAEARATQVEERLRASGGRVPCAQEHTPAQHSAGRLRLKVERLAALVEQESLTFFRCYACGHQHDNFLQDCDIYSWLWDSINSLRMELPTSADPQSAEGVPALSATEEP